MTPTPPGQRPPIAPANVPVDGEALRACRKGKGLSITDLAGLVGVHRSYVSKIERGDRGAAVHPRIVKAIAEQLETDPGTITRK